MTIQSLRLENYRSFSTLQLEFAPRLNVFAGENGSGKSTILEALITLLSWWSNRLSSSSRSASGKPVEPLAIRNGTRSCRASLTALFHDIPENKITWSIYQVRPGHTPMGRNELMDLTVAVNQWRELHGRDGYDPFDSIPVIVQYPVTRAALDIPNRIRTHHDFGMLTIYDRKLFGDADFRNFFEWFRDREDLENEKRRDGSEELDRPLSAVRTALNAFLPAFTNWRIRRNPMHMEVTKQGKAVWIDQLSDGEKNLVAMVGDIAMRLALANPVAKDPLKGHGIVMIDEVELHLHPAWQQSVLFDLLATFPGLQFFITTHSPFVLSKLNNIVLRERMRPDGDLKTNSDIAVFSMGNGLVESMIDPETGLLKAGRMDEVADDIDREFTDILEKGSPK